MEFIAAVEAAQIAANQDGKDRGLRSLHGSWDVVTLPERAARRGPEMTYPVVSAIRAAPGHGDPR